MIGVLGGTFDPIHFGHLRPALDCLQGLGLEQVRFVPLNVAVHRPQPEAAPVWRRAMVEAAISGQAGFVLDDRELRRPGGSYSYETLASVRAELGASRPLCLLVGGDAFAGFLEWHRPDDILALAHLVVLPRPGGTASWSSRLRTLLNDRICDQRSDLLAAPAGRILQQDVTQIDVSSTRVRRLIREGRSPRYLLPDATLDIIEREGLYRCAD